MLVLQLLCGVQLLSTTLQSAVAVPTERYTAVRQTRVLNRSQIKHKGEWQNANGLTKYTVAEPSGPTPLTTKSAIRHNPEQVSSNHYLPLNLCLTFI